MITAPQVDNGGRSDAKQQSSLWLAASLIVAMAFAWDGLQAAFTSAYTVHNDARQHVFWMWRLLDPALFPSDLIADYFQSVSPFGYTALFKLFASFGIDPFLLNKCLPFMLGILASIYCFNVCIQILPVPSAAFTATLLLNQNLWLRDDLSSGTPRAFVYPLLLALMYYLLRGSLRGCIITIFLQGLLYPQTVFISVAMLFLRLFEWQHRLPNLSKTGHRYRFFVAGLGTALLVMLPYAFRLSQFDPVITVTEARQLPEFYSGGRSAFFLPNPWAYWLYANRSGILPSEWQYVALMSFGCLLPLLQRYPRKFPLTCKIRRDRAAILVTLSLASLGMFLLAHLFLFTLHLPSRYTQHSVRILMALVDGMFIAVILHAVSTRLAIKLETRLPRPKIIASLLLGCVVMPLLLWPSYAVRAYPYRLGYVTGEAPALYQFLRRQPKDVIVASLAREADFIPTFAKRSVLVSEEYSIPYHTGYYRLLRARTIALLHAQYSQTPAPVRRFLQQNDVDFWLVEQHAFTAEYIENNAWLMQFQPAASHAVDMLKQGKRPILSTLMHTCAVLQDQHDVLLSTTCMLTALPD